MHGDVGILLGLVIQLSLVSIESRVISHLTEILLLTFLCLGKQGVVVGVEEHSPIFEDVVLVVALCVIVAGVDELHACVGERRCESLSELWLYLSLLVGLSVILDTLQAIHRGVVSRLVVCYGVVRSYLLLEHLCLHVLSLDSVLRVKGLKRELSHVVVSLGLLLGVGHGAEVLLQQL